MASITCTPCSCWCQHWPGGLAGDYRPVGLCPCLSTGHSATAPKWAEQGQGSGLLKELLSKGGRPCWGLSRIPLTWLLVLLHCLARMDCAEWEYVAYHFTEDTDNNMVNEIFAITSRSPSSGVPFGGGSGAYTAWSWVWSGWHWPPCLSVDELLSPIKLYLHVYTQGEAE